MKTSFVVSAVVGAHCVAVGSALLIQGCGTTRGPVSMPTEAPLPPSSIAQAEAPVVVPERDAPVLVKPAASTTTPPKMWEDDDVTTYVVGKGDTLSHISQRFGVSVARIMTLNNIADPNRVRLGQKLMLPGKIDLTKPVKSTTKPASTRRSRPLPAGSSAYVVQAGDCLSVIAAKAGVTTKALKEANSIQADKIYVGQKLAIPGGKAISTKPPKVQPPKVQPTASPIVDKPAPVELDTGELSLADLDPEPPEPTGSVTMYTVKADDDILSVASEHNVSIADLRRVNRLSSDLLVPGQKLVIPTQD
jgi:LysM repeat protein